MSFGRLGAGFGRLGSGRRRGDPLAPGALTTEGAVALTAEDGTYLLIEG